MKATTPMTWSGVGIVVKVVGEAGSWAGEPGGLTKSAAGRDRTSLRIASVPLSSRAYVGGLRIAASPLEEGEVP